MLIGVDIKDKGSWILINGSIQEILVVDEVDIVVNYTKDR